MPSTRPSSGSLTTLTEPVRVAVALGTIAASTFPGSADMAFVRVGADSTPRPVVNAGRLWAGGLATAVVAALIAVVGILVGRGLFGVAVLAPKGAGVWGDADTGWYALGAALFSLAATGLMTATLPHVGRYLDAELSRPIDLVCRDRLFAADGPPEEMARPAVVQGSLEGSNVRPVLEMTRLIGDQRGVQLSAQFIEQEGKRGAEAVSRILGRAA